MSAASISNLIAGGRDRFGKTSGADLTQHNYQRVTPALARSSATMAVTKASNSSIGFQLNAARALDESPKSLVASIGRANLGSKTA